MNDLDALAKLAQALSLRGGHLVFIGEWSHAFVDSIGGLTNRYLLAVQT